MGKCKNCIHYTPSTIEENPKDTDNCHFKGECAKMGDDNIAHMQSNICNAYDYESYAAGVYVGPDFGCIHFKSKRTTKK